MGTVLNSNGYIIVRLLIYRVTDCNTGRFMNFRDFGNSNVKGASTKSWIRCGEHRCRSSKYSMLDTSGVVESALDVQKSTASGPGRQGSGFSNLPNDPCARFSAIWAFPRVRARNMGPTL